MNVINNALERTGNKEDQMQGRIVTWKIGIEK